MKLTKHFLCDGCKRKSGQPHAADCKLVKPRTRHSPDSKGSKGLSVKESDYLARKYGR